MESPPLPPADYDGIGEGSGAATKVGENNVTWEKAKSAMNDSLNKSGHNYNYQDNSDQDMPFIIVKEESSD